MARIRTIKPEFWTDEDVMECSPNARLMFIGLWNFADDAGRLRASDKQIKAKIFPADQIDETNIRGWIDELSSNGLVTLYVVDNKEYLQINGWHNQKIDRPQQSKIPPPSNPDRRTFDEYSSADSKGEEGIGEERKEVGAGKKSKDYAFEGKIIRIDHSQADAWRRNFPKVDLIPELTAADAYYVDNPPKDGKWFFAASNWLKRSNERAIEKQFPHKQSAPGKMDRAAVDALMGEQG